MCVCVCVCVCMYACMSAGGGVDACGEGSGNDTLFCVHAVGKGLSKVALQSMLDPTKYLRLKDGILDCNGTQDPWSTFRVCVHAA